MKSARFSSWLVIAVLTVGSSNVCQAEGWSLPSLWPFGKQKASTKKIPTKTASFPKLNTKSSWLTADKKKSANQSSTFDRFATGSKKMWNSTKKLVTPSSKSFHWPSSKRKKSRKPKAAAKKKSSLFSQLFRPEEPPRGPLTTKEFLKQRRLER